MLITRISLKTKSVEKDLVCLFSEWSYCRHHIFNKKYLQDVSLHAYQKKWFREVQWKLFHSKCNVQVKVKMYMQLFPS